MKTTLGKGWESSTKIIDKSKTARLENTGLVKTNDYNKLTFDIHNRPINEGKVHFFMKEFSAGRNFLREFPGVVTKEYVVLDGQHRLEACRRLNIPFYFRIAETLTIIDVTRVQVNAGWSIRDYLHSYIKQGKQDYVVLQRFMNRYNISATIAMCLLTGKARSGPKKSGFYIGEFKVVDETRAHKQAKMIYELGSKVGDLHRDPAFSGALVKIFNHSEYEHKRMSSQFEKHSGMIRRHSTVNNYIRNLEEVYNYRLYQKNKVRFL